MADLLLFPPSSKLSSSMAEFLDHNFKTLDDLLKITTVQDNLNKECLDLDRHLMDLSYRFSEVVASFSSHSDTIKGFLGDLKLKLSNFRVSGPCDESVNNNIGSILSKELPLLAKEVGRVEMVRVYGETTLKLEALVGDLEDSVVSIMNINPRKGNPMIMGSAPNQYEVETKQQKLVMAINSINLIEDMLTNLVKSQPQWSRLLKAVDSRVEQSLAILRPQAIADYRALLTCIGWPPPLSVKNLDQGEKNPLIVMHGSIKENYSQSVLSLCTLQHSHILRRARICSQLRHNKENRLLDLGAVQKPNPNELLWTIEELVSPIYSRMEPHIAKWADKPEFIFALVYKVTWDLVDGVDYVLQPLIDRARLSGYSAREEWVSGMVAGLSLILSKQIFSILANRYRDGDREVKSLWLHLVDLVLSFDKRMQELVSSDLSLPIAKIAHTDASLLSPRSAVIHIFCDQPEWFVIWTEIELEDAEEKLKTQLEKDTAWIVDKGSKFESESPQSQIPESFLLSTIEDYRAPPIADSTIKLVFSLIERCRSLPNVLFQIQFIKLTTSPILHWFLDLLIWQCQEIDLSASLGDDAVISTIMNCINAAGYCVSVLREWSEKLTFLEMRSTEEEIQNQIDKALPETPTYFFDEEIEKLGKFQTEWLSEIMANFLREFDNYSHDYVKNKKQWQETGGEAFDTVDGSSGFAVLSISTEFIAVLDNLQGRIRNLNIGLNAKDFSDLWRSIAGGLDRFIFKSLCLGGTKFLDRRTKQFAIDMKALFSVFKPFCVRPEAFFPFISDSLKLLAMSHEEAKHLGMILGALNSSVDKRKLELLRHGIHHISPRKALKILRNHIY
ncbi:RINT1-like protein MAG2 isoform X2 [Amborella trichopoda]|uniref:RINT1-like protein MAG2 isoform X2 n=1 Tax=Amborella trichopoda TaxID=13333 RepID=UPI0005D449EC|nr:RINT1-like protein MAG2 isoform X2 [Amborella trichopoda]|eukprot:XP_011620440.1 RINT1-like protein MAG2 isoform X2 [Amborella trichopoda]